MSHDIKIRVNDVQYKFVVNLSNSNVDTSLSGVVRKIIDAFVILSKTDIFNILTPMTKEIATINHRPFSHELKVTLSNVHIMYVDRISSNTGDNRSQAIRKMISIMYIWNNTGFYKFLKPVGEDISAFENAINTNNINLY